MRFKSEPHCSFADRCYSVGARPCVPTAGSACCTAVELTVEGVDDCGGVVRRIFRYTTAFEGERGDPLVETVTRITEAADSFYITRCLQCSGNIDGGFEMSNGDMSVHHESLLLR